MLGSVVEPFSVVVELEFVEIVLSVVNIAFGPVVSVVLVNSEVAVLVNL